MSANQSQALSQIIEQITGDHVYEKKGSRFFFKIYLNSRMSETPIEALDLGVRAVPSIQARALQSILQVNQAKRAMMHMMFIATSQLGTLQMISMKSSTITKMITRMKMKLTMQLKIIGTIITKITMVFQLEAVLTMTMTFLMKLIWQAWTEMS